MKEVKIYSNADHVALEELATLAVNDPRFLEIHYSGHSILVIYQATEKKESQSKLK
jgi:hypothetical protein